MWKASQYSQRVSGSVHTTREKFENTASFQQFGLPSTLIRHENRSFQIRS